MKRRYIPSIAVMGLAAMAATPARAGIPVFDALNFVSNVAQNFQLLAIKHSLTNNSEGTVVYNTTNIDKSTSNIDNTTKKIYDIDVANLEYTKNNYDIDMSFKWIINQHGNEYIPVPRELVAKLDAIHGKGIGEYTANFQDAAAHVGGAERNVASQLFEGSRARKAANDMLVESIVLEREAMDDEAGALNKLHDATMKAQGHGHQLQVANALSASQINQMMKLRSSLLVSEAQRAAEAQVAADKDARAIAVANTMRAGMGDVMSSAKPLSAAR